MIPSEVELVLKEYTVPSAHSDRDGETGESRAISPPVLPELYLCGSALCNIYVLELSLETPLTHFQLVVFTSDPIQHSWGKMRSLL